MALNTALPQSRYPAHQPGFWRRGIKILRVSIVLLAVLVIGGSVGMLSKLIIDPNGSEEFTVSRRPSVALASP